MKIHRLQNGPGLTRDAIIAGIGAFLKDVPMTDVTRISSTIAS